jgi:uncharacterized protein
MTATLFDRHRVIDIDTHVTEPANLWVDRVSSKWGDQVPHVKRVEGVDRWFIGDQTAGIPGAYSNAGHDDYYPNFRKTFDDIPASMYDSTERLKFMDQEKLYANIMYPNVGGFGAGSFLKIKDRKLTLECLQAYNDWLFEWCSVDSNRLIPVAAMPFWNLEQTVAEVKRVAEMGYRAILFCNQPQDHGMPTVRDKFWDPVWATAQEAGLSVNFHIGGGDLSDLLNDTANIGLRANWARVSTMAFIDNGKSITDIICGGIPHRFPELKMVSVESGAGWMPFLLESLDWQWHNSGVITEHAEYDLLPSEYFKRQMYASFWFEERGLANAIEQYPDNILFETDYPHPTCQAPGPASSGTHPELYAEKALAGISEDILGKVLHSTAAELYGIV